MKIYMFWAPSLQLVIFSPWKVPWDWIVFSQNSFVISPGSLYHLIKRDTGRLANEAFTSNPIVSSKKLQTVSLFLCFLRFNENKYKSFICCISKMTNFTTYISLLVNFRAYRIRSEYSAAVNNSAPVWEKTYKHKSVILQEENYKVHFNEEVYWRSIATVVYKQKNDIQLWVFTTTIKTLEISLKFYCFDFTAVVTS